MKTKYIIAIIVAIVLITLFTTYNYKPDTKSGDNGETSEEITNTKTSGTNKPAQQGVAKPSTPVKTPQISKTFPELELINQRLSFNLSTFDRVKFTIEKVAFGRGDAAKSTGCQGIPNANFSTYLYPGNSICLGDSSVDGSKRGIVAFHILVENNGSTGFGGNSDILKLHYLRAGSGGEINHRFAYPLSGLDSYYIGGYSSKEIILSYIVPEDQQVFDLIINYNEPAIENKTLNVYENSKNGILVDFSNKSIKLVK